MKTILIDAVGTFVIEGEGIYQSMLDLLETYPNGKIIVSNANDEEIPKFGLTDLPYELFTLKHNPDKTDPEYFRRLFRHYAFNASDVIYFEHNLDAVRNAQSLGITSYHYDPLTMDLVGLKNFLDSNL